MRTEYNIIKPNNGQPPYLTVMVGDNMEIELRDNKLFCWGYDEEGEQLPAYPDGWSRNDYTEDLSKICEIAEEMVDTYECANFF